jgi:hypothetical protein
MYKFFFFFILALTLPGCMYKSVMKDEADDINKSIL